MNNPNEEVKFDYKNVNIGKIEVILDKEPNKKGVVSNAIKGVVIDDEVIAPSGRFWDSLYSKYGLSNSFFKYFSFQEIFQRISERAPDPNARVCIERQPGGDPRLLALTGLNKPIVAYDDFLTIIKDFDPGAQLKYDKGVISSTHAHNRSGNEFDIAGDRFSNQFVFQSPIDGYGTPNFYVSLLRLICSNGAVGYARAFQSTLNLGSGSDDVRYTIKRAMESFNNEEGFAHIRDRFEAATRSWASLNEQASLYKLILRLQSDSVMGKPSAISALERFSLISGKPYEIYRNDPNAFTDKKLRTLPVECRVYDLINFATELATHKVSEGSSRSLNAWVGQMLSNDFDLENSCDTFDNWRDFFLKENLQKYEDDKRKNSESGNGINDDEDGDDE